MALSMMIFGTIAVFVRYLSLSPGELALYRAVMAALPIGIFLLFKKEKIRFSVWKKEGVLLVLSGASLGINWILLFEAYKHTTVSTATLCYYFAPVIVTVVSTLVFREKLTKGQILCFLMSTVGLVLITGFSDLSTNGVGIAFGLGAACFYALVVLLNKRIRSVGGLQRTFLQFISAAVILLPYVLLSEGIHLQALDGISWMMLLVVGLVHTGIAYVLYFTSVADLPGQQIAILSYIDPLVAILISVFLLSEPMTALQIVGGILILVFSLWNEWISGRKNNQ
jgi:RarD protein